MQQLPLIAASIARPIVAYLNAHGQSSTAYLDRVRIPEEVIESGGWIAKKQLYDMLHDVVQREHRPNIIFEAFSEFEIDDAAPIAGALKSARTLKDALRVVTRLAGHAYEGNEYFLRSENDTTWLCYREPVPVSPGSDAGQQATLAIFLKMVRLLTNRNFCPALVCSQFQLNRNFHSADGWQECQWIYRAEYAAIALPRSWMRCELTRAQESQLSVAEALEWQPENSFDDQFVGSLHRLIASRFLFNAFPTLEQVASFVGLSTRTIKRRLASEGLSYRHLLDRICFDAAREMLVDENCSVKETALALGFSDTSKFVRSFRRMTGVTPGEYKHHAR